MRGLILPEPFSARRDLLLMDVVCSQGTVLCTANILSLNLLECFLTRAPRNLGNSSKWAVTSCGEDVRIVLSGRSGPSR